MLTSTVLALALLTGGNGNAQQEDMTSTPEEFQEYAKLMSGRWSGEVTLAADWPGLSKKRGEKLVVYAVCQPVADGHGVLETVTAGEVSILRLYKYDRAKKQITRTAVATTGSGSTTVIWKDGDKWKSKSSGALGDGRKTTGFGHTWFKNNGRTLMTKGGGTIGGKARDNSENTFVKLSK